VRRTTFAVLTVLFGAMLAGLALEPPRVAQACSAGPDDNPAAGSDLIVAGYVTEVQILGRTDLMMFLDLELTFEVDRYVRGSGPSTLQLFDSRSGVPPRELVPTSAAFAELDVSLLDVDDLGYDGGSGACGALDEDPRGRYWVVGLSPHPETGNLTMYGPSTCAVGSGPQDPRVLDGIARARTLLAQAGLPTPASTGNLGLASRGSDASSSLLLVAALLVTVLLLAGGRRASAR